jgi:hypothetical protein
MSIWSQLCAFLDISKVYPTNEKINRKIQLQHRTKDFNLGRKTVHY